MKYLIPFICFFAFLKLSSANLHENTNNVEIGNQFEGEYENIRLPSLLHLLPSKLQSIIATIDSTLSSHIDHLTGATAAEEQKMQELDNLFSLQKIIIDHITFSNSFIDIFLPERKFAQQHWNVDHSKNIYRNLDGIEGEVDKYELARQKAIEHISAKYQFISHDPEMHKMLEEAYEKFFMDAKNPKKHPKIAALFNQIDDNSSVNKKLAKRLLSKYKHENRLTEKELEEKITFCKTKDLNNLLLMLDLHFVEQVIGRLQGFLVSSKWDEKIRKSAEYLEVKELQNTMTDLFHLVTFQKENIRKPKYHGDGQIGWADFEHLKLDPHTLDIFKKN